MVYDSSKLAVHLFLRRAQTSGCSRRNWFRAVRLALAVLLAAIVVLVSIFLNNPCPSIKPKEIESIIQVGQRRKRQIYPLNRIAIDQGILEERMRICDQHDKPKRNKYE